MSQTNQHNSSLTVSQNEDTQQKPKIDIHCSPQASVTHNESTIETRIESEASKETNSINENDEKKLDDNEIRSIGNDLDIINNEEVIATTDEQVSKCEPEFKAQIEQLSVNSLKQDSTNTLATDESRDQLINKSTNDNLEDSKDSKEKIIDPIENAELVVTIDNQSKEDLIRKLNLEENLNSESASKISSNSNLQINANLNKQQIAKSSTKLSENYLLKSLTKETKSIVNSKRTLNAFDSLDALNRQNSNLPNKRKIDSLQIVVSRKSPRLTESQSYHSDNSIYLFEPLRKRSSSISSTNSTVFTDLAR